MTIECPPLEHISTSVPEDESHSVSFESGQPRLTNAIRLTDSKTMTQIDPEIILNEVLEHTSGWPKNVAGELVCLNRDGQLDVLKKQHRFFAWLFEHFEVDWKKCPGITKAEFFEYATRNTEKFDAFCNHPHFPPIDGLLYQHDEPVPADGEALEQFLDFFDPQTHEDRELIKAFLLTLFWGGPSGQRPAFLITTDGSGPTQGVGDGKSTLLQKCSELCGGTITWKHREQTETFFRRLVNQADGKPRPRVLEMDNVKTRRFSSAELESLITGSHVDGHKLFCGNSSLPNWYTVAITINGASLSRDLASRCVVIMIRPAVKSQTWLKELDDFIKWNKWSIIGDIEQLLAFDAPPLPDDGATRWAYWESSVLAKVTSPIAVRDLIKAHQALLDDDAANRNEFLEFLLADSNFHCHNDNEIGTISHQQMRTILTEFLGKSLGANVVKKTVEAMGLPCVKQVRPNGRSNIWLVRRDGEPLTPEQISAATNPTSAGS
jgi:hypothetical protein